jgi:hypothetical protein
MRKVLVASAIALSLMSVNANAADPCKAIICLAGELTGEGGGSECSDAIQDYLGIQVWKHGKFKPSDTAKKRNSFLNGCPADAGEYKKKIGDKFGKVLSL